MSKSDSNLFHGTSGAGKALIAQAQISGVKIDPDKVVAITKDPNGRIIWLETGNSSSGLQHIINNHGKEFNGRGIKNEDIPKYLLEAVRHGKIVGYQGKRNPRPIYEFTYKGQKQRVAIQIGDNGYIVSANCVSIKTEDTND